MPKKRTVTQKNVDKINRNLQSIARVFGTESKPYEIAAQKLFLGGFKTYDKLVNGVRVIQMENTKENRKQHQKIRKIAKERQSINQLKRKYAPKGVIPEEPDDYIEDVAEDAPRETFLQWYSRISSNFMDAIDEVYALQDSLEFLSIPYDNHKIWYDEDYQLQLWEQIYDKLIADTAAAKDFYDKMGFGIDEESGEVVTATNVPNTSEVGSLMHQLDLSKADQSFFEWMKPYVDYSFGQEDEDE